MEKIFDVIVVGGGPAGMMAAGRAGELGAKVLLLEKNEKLGKKLSITGGRRCNITNAEFDTSLFLDNFSDAKGFLFSPFSKFDVQSTFDFFEGRNLPLKIEERKRAFPVSERAQDVCQVLEKYIKETGNVTVSLSEGVLDLIVDNGEKIGVKTIKGSHLGQKIILATGGYAAPETGSTGEGVRWLTKVGHTVSDPNPSLVPLKTSAKWVHCLSGVVLENISIHFVQNKKTAIKRTGRLLFTHFGISGPLVINISQEVINLLKKGSVEAVVDLFPQFNEGELDKFLLKIFEENSKKQAKNILASLFPNKLIDELAGLFEFLEKPASEFSREERKKLGKILKNLSFPITGTMGLKWAIVADGGVDPKEVNFKTMQSRLKNNLYLVGDTLNINRPSGGFSLQLCWTTGWVAGTHSAQIK